MNPFRSLGCCTSAKFAVGSGEVARQHAASIKSRPSLQGVRQKPTYLEGQGDFVSRLIMGIIRVTIWVVGVINLLTKSP